MSIEQALTNSAIADQDLNCSEAVLQAGNLAHDLQLSPAAMRMAGGFGGGVGGQELLCGALSGGVMALSTLFIKECAHESDLIKRIVQDYFNLFEKEMGSSDCAPLKEVHRTEELGCKLVIAASARCLDRIIERYKADLA